MALSGEPALRADNLSLPSLKDLAAELNIKPTQLTIQLRNLHYEIITLNHNEPDVFCSVDEIPCRINFRYFDNYEYFNVGLKTMPLTGNCIEFFFMKPAVGSGWFYVRQVHHELSFMGHSISIEMHWHSENLYLGLLREKAKLHGEISVMEDIGFERDYKLQQRLIAWDKTR